MRYGFGVDVGGTSVKIAYFSQEGDMLDKWEIPTRRENGGEQILPDIATAINCYITQKNLEKAQIIGIGVGVPGPVLNASVVNRCANLGWSLVDVGQILGDLTGLNVRVGNDANVAALGEAWKGSAQGFRNMVLATLGTGIGGGIVSDGRLLNGAHAAGGEIGHVILNPEETEPCGCGMHGCAEQYGSASGVVRVTKRHLSKSAGESVLRNREDFTCKDVFDAAAAGDTLAQESLEQVYGYLGRLLGTVTNIVDPEVIVIGGGVSKAGQVLLDGIARHFPKYTFHAARGNVEFRIATLGNDAGAYGAFKLVLDELG